MAVSLGRIHSIIRRFSSSLDWSLQSFFFSPRCFSLGSRTRNSAYRELRLFLCSGALRRILSSALWIGFSLQIYLTSVMSRSSTIIGGILATICSCCLLISLFRIVCLTFLMGAVIELVKPNIWMDQCPFLFLTLMQGLPTTTLEMASVPGSRSRYSGLGQL